MCCPCPGGDACECPGMQVPRIDVRAVGGQLSDAHGRRLIGADGSGCVIRGERGPELEITPEMRAKASLIPSHGAFDLDNPLAS